MVLNELWHLKPVSEAAISYGIDRGVAQNLMGTSQGMTNLENYF